MKSIRSFQIAALLGLVGLIGSGVTGNVIYARNPYFPITPEAKLLGAVLILSLAAFLVAIVPVLLRLFLRAQQKLGNQDQSMIRWLAENERKVWWLVWGMWAVGGVIAGIGVLAGK